MKADSTWKRILWLFRYDWALNYKKYLLMATVLVALVAVLFGIYALTGARVEMMLIQVLGAVGLFVFQGIHASLIWSDFSSKPRRIAFLALPAKQSEVFIQKLISNFVLFPVLFIVFWISVLHLALLYNTLFHSSSDSVFSLITFSAKSLYVFKITIASYFACSALFFFGATRFKRLAIPKIFAAAFVSLFCLWPVAILLRFIITGKYNTMIVPLIAYVDKFSGVLVESICPNFTILFLGFLSLSLIVISYVQYKEKTI